MHPTWSRRTSRDGRGDGPIAIHNAVTPDGPQFDLSPSSAEFAKEKIGAAAQVNDPHAYADVLGAMNPPGDPATDKALREYFRDASYDENILSDAGVEEFTSEVAPVSQGGYAARGGAQQVMVTGRTKWTDPNAHKLGEIRGSL